MPSCSCVSCHSRRRARNQCHPGEFAHTGTFSKALNCFMTPNTRRRTASLTASSHNFRRSQGGIFTRLWSLGPFFRPDIGPKRMSRNSGIALTGPSPFRERGLPERNRAPRPISTWEGPWVLKAALSSCNASGLPLFSLPWTPLRP